MLDAIPMDGMDWDPRNPFKIMEKTIIKSLIKLCPHFEVRFYLEAIVECFYQFQTAILSISSSASPFCLSFFTLFTLPFRHILFSIFFFLSSLYRRFFLVILYGSFGFRAVEYFQRISELSKHVTVTAKVNFTQYMYIYLNILAIIAAWQYLCYNFDFELTNMALQRKC